MIKRLWQLDGSATIFSFLTAVLGMAVAISSATQLGFGSKSEIGPGLFPFIVGVILTGTGFICGISSLRCEGGRKEQEPQLTHRGFRRIVYMIMAFILWLLLTPPLGYVPATFVVSIALAKTAGLERWRWPIVLSLGITLFLYVLFDLFFYVDLPRGILG